MRIFSATIAAFVLFTASTESAAKPQLSPAGQEIEEEFWKTEARPMLALIDSRSKIRAQIAKELDQAKPSWSRLESLLNEHRAIDLKFRAESVRMELKLLGELPMEDRLTRMKWDYGKPLPPKIIVVEPSN
jgi:hypothetical protein